MLRLPGDLLDQILAHAREALPEECVGLLFGHGGLVCRVERLKNVSPRPKTEYLADPLDLLAALRKADEVGEEVLAVYHSHPRGPALPSERDRNQAVWRTIYVIIDPVAEEVRAFRLPAGEEVELVVE